MQSWRIFLLSFYQDQSKPLFYWHQNTIGQVVIGVQVILGYHIMLRTYSIENQKSGIYWDEVQKTNRSQKVNVKMVNLLKPR